VDNHLDDDVGNGVRALRDGRVNRFGYFLTTQMHNEKA
jgi:hypothetical protein